MPEIDDSSAIDSVLTCQSHIPIQRFTVNRQLIIGQLHERTNHPSKIPMSRGDSMIDPKQHTYPMIRNSISDPAKRLTACLFFFPLHYLIAIIFCWKG